MARNQPRFPRLNLARSGVKLFTVYGGYSVTEDRLALLSELTDKRRSALFGPRVVSSVRYTPRRGEAPTYSIVAVSHVADDENEIHLSIAYREVDEGNPRPSTRRVSEADMLEMVYALGTPNDVDCVVLFEYKDRQPSQLWFPLPVLLAGTSPEESFEVRGVRVAKLNSQNSDSEFEFILDRPNPDQVVLQVFMNLGNSMEPEALRAALLQAEKISSDLVAHS